MQVNIIEMKNLPSQPKFTTSSREAELLGPSTRASHSLSHVAEVLAPAESRAGCRTLWLSLAAATPSLALRKREVLQMKPVGAAQAARVWSG